MDYNRLVAYIYSYNDGLKSRNTGFAKIEVRNNVLKMLINMKGAYTNGLSEWDVNFFTRNNGVIEPVKVGEICLKGGLGEFRYTGDAEKIGAEELDFRQISGLFLCSDKVSGKLFASEWDDLGFNADKIIKSSVMELEVAEIPEKKEIPKEEKQVEIFHVPESEKSVEMLTHTEMDSSTINEINIEDLYVGKERLMIFSDDDIYDIIEITPEDLLKTSETNWGLKNNSFLNHGYYNFRHLILGKLYRPSGCGYIVGVPGIYTRRDRQMAAMYGFVKFKFSMRSDMRLGQFGYWYKEINC